MKDDIAKFLGISQIYYKATYTRVYMPIEDKLSFEHKYRRLSRTFARHDTYKKFISRCKKLGIFRWEDISLMYCLIQLGIPLYIESLDRGRGRILFEIDIYDKYEDYGNFYRIGQILAGGYNCVFIDSNKIIWDNIESRLVYFSKHGM